MSAISVQTDSNIFRFGTQSLKATTGDTGDNALFPADAVAVTPDEARTFSAYIRTDAPITDGEVYLRIAQGGVLSPVLAESDPVTDTSLLANVDADGWARVSVTLVVPSGVFTVRPFIQYAGSTGDQVFWIDGVKFERGDVASLWQENIVSRRAVVDQSGFQVDASLGGIVRYLGAAGGARDTVELADHGFRFGGDTELASADADELEVNGVRLSKEGHTHTSTPPTIAPPVRRVYTANDTWNLPANLSHIEVEVVGGGGGGGGADSGASVSVAGGGGGGGYSRRVISLADMGADTTGSVTRGAGGSGGPAGNNAGSNGGTSSFVINGVTVQATGGGGGDSQANGTSIATAAGGAGGIGSGGDINVVGSDGTLGIRHTGTQYVNGNGGASGGGMGGATRGNATDGGGGGSNGAQYGGGGAGGHNGGGAGSQSGGTGANGVVIVTEYYKAV